MYSSLKEKKRKRKRKRKIERERERDRRTVIERAVQGIANANENEIAGREAALLEGNGDGPRHTVGRAEICSLRHCRSLSQ